MLRRLVAIVLVLWLPLQAVAAIAMPFCKHALQPDGHHIAQTHHAIGDHVTHADHAMHHPDSGDDQAAHDAKSLNCDTCGLCHLACSGFLAASATVTLLPPLDAGPFYAIASLSSVPLEQPYRPPLSAAA